MALNFQIPEILNVFGRTKALRVKENYLNFLGNQSLTKRIANLEFPRIAFKPNPGAPPEINNNEFFWFGEDYEGNISLPNLAPFNAFWLTIGTLEIKRIIDGTTLELQSGNETNVRAYTRFEVDLSQCTWWEFRVKFKYSNTEEKAEHVIGFAGGEGIISHAHFYNETGAANNWVFKSADSTSGVLTSDTFTITKDEWHELRAYWNGTTIFYYVDQTRIGSSARDPDYSSKLFFRIEGTVGISTDHSIFMDWFTIKYY